jgi:tripartite-type tricarboxylate transporter receptor subunit TctC
MLVAFPPGGPADVLARAMQPSMAKVLGQPVIIENLPGAGGALAVQRLLSKPADGYTLIMGSPNEASSRRCPTPRRSTSPKSSR